MPTVKLVDQKDIVENIYIGDDKDGKAVTIDEQSFLKNGLLIIGTKNSGKKRVFNQLAKSSIVVPTLDTKGKVRTPLSTATTVMIASKPDHCFYLYAIPREYRRNKSVKLISPSTNMQVRNELLGMKSFDYDKVNEILDFTQLCKDKGIAVIDMEHYRYEDASIRAVGMLLLNLQIEMHDTAGTGKRRFYLMIDDAWLYLPYLSSILKYGSEYNMSSVLAFDSRSQYKEQETIIENNIQNVLLMGNLRFEDAKYFSERFDIPLPELLNGGNDHGYLASYDKDMHFSVKKFFFTDKTINEEDDRLISNLASRYKKELIKASADEEYIKDIMTAYAQYIAEQNQGYDVGTTADSMRRVAQEIEASVTGIPVTSLKPAPPKPVESDTKQDEPVTILGNVRQEAVAAPTAPKPTLRKPDPSGLKALMGVVESAPPRIQKEVKRQGFPVDDAPVRQSSLKQSESNKKKDNPQAPQRSFSGERGTFAPSAPTSGGFDRNQGLPTYKTVGDDTSKNKGQTPKPDQQRSKNKRKKKKNRQNEPRPTNDTPTPSVDASVKKLENEKQNTPSQQQRSVPKTKPAPETPQKRLKDDEKAAKRPANVPKAKDVVEEASETAVKEIEELIKETVVELQESLGDDEGTTPNEEQGTSDIETTVDVESETTEPDNDKEVDKETPKDGDDEEIVLDDSDLKIGETDEDDIIKLDDDVELVEEEPEESLDLFRDNETPKKSPQGGLVGLSNNMAMLSFNTRSSGRDFTNDVPSSSQMIEKLKDRPRSANFFSKRREIELMERK